MNLTKKTVFVILFTFIVNAIIVFFFYKFYLQKEINENTYETIELYAEKLNEIIPLFEESNDIGETCKKISKEKEINLIIKDENANIICSTGEKNITYYVTSIFRKDNKTYSINYSDDTQIKMSPFLIIRVFIFVELIISFIIIALGLIIANVKLFAPIQRLQNDIRTYGKGVKPKKRKIRTSIDEIQNNYVSVIEALEEEKTNRNRIIASISHDIKTPLTSIIGYASRLDNVKLQEETKEKYVKKIYNKSLSIKELIEEFDDYLSCNIKDTLKLELVNINDLFEEIKKDYKDELEEKNIKLKLLNNCKNNKIIIDKLKIKRVFSNIITNSVNHIKSKTGIIEIKCYNKDKEYEFYISDNGEGVKTKNINQIFDVLYTTDPSRKIPGLGLSICKEIIEVHNGTITAFNNEMGGLSIMFSIKK